MFFVFRDSYVLYIFVMNSVCTIHLSVSWVCYKCPLGECFYNKIIPYTRLITKTLLRRLTLHLSDTSFISQHHKTHPCLTSKYRKILTENSSMYITERKTTKTPISFEVLYTNINNPSLHKINFECSSCVLKSL